MKKIKPYLIEIIIFLLVILWVYTASSKLIDYGRFKVQMHNQTIPPLLATILIYTLPAAEIITAILLLNKSTKALGFYISASLMLVFTAYIGLVLTNFFGRIPCSCGGVLQVMNWPAHLVFNLFFLLLTFYGSYHVYRERRDARTS
ncbi:hypothetical protein D0C36_19350 [Mucilaginibacter conchicola]|uniref:Methylamine utilisation protein MauE domain-containing protein n=1 Tax=Mucilaginibacter conchicola TaxID=2303333 RepID=A0A372NR34_9SPHI|nr:MauE/DoxX family redox-associated membrane protein [Mucilaginibacter conchicola]RFZ91100.1 hypothetical protein D0C36_19350 [Mucilaginibacter conchicola]